MTSAKMTTTNTTKRKRSSNWTLEEDTMLIEAQVDVSMGSKSGSSQKKEVFWTRIKELFVHKMQARGKDVVERTWESLFNRQRRVKSQCQKFREHLKKAESITRSGWTENDYKMEALKLFKISSRLEKLEKLSADASEEQKSGVEGDDFIWYDAYLQLKRLASFNEALEECATSTQMVKDERKILGRKEIRELSVESVKTSPDSVKRRHHKKKVNTKASSTDFSDVIEIQKTTSRQIGESTASLQRTEEFAVKVRSLQDELNGLKGTLEVFQGDKVMEEKVKTRARFLYGEIERVREEERREEEERIKVKRLAFEDEIDSVMPSIEMTQVETFNEEKEDVKDEEVKEEEEEEEVIQQVKKETRQERIMKRQKTDVIEAPVEMTQKVKKLLKTLGPYNNVPKE